MHQCSPQALFTLHLSVFNLAKFKIMRKNNLLPVYKALDWNVTNFLPFWHADILMWKSYPFAKSTPFQASHKKKKKKNEMFDIVIRHWQWISLRQAHHSELAATSHCSDDINTHYSPQTLVCICLFSPLSNKSKSKLAPFIISCFRPVQTALPGATQNDSPVTAVALPS